MTEGDMTDLERNVHNCRDCYPEYECVMRRYPVYSFGRLHGKLIWVVPINPSTAEHEQGFLSTSPKTEHRRHSQQSYFSGVYYRFFFDPVAQFFGGEVQEQVVQWNETPWEKVGFTDLVKCATKRSGKPGQFSSLTLSQRQKIAEKCGKHLKCQLSTYRPKLVVAYGAPVRAWFAKQFTPGQTYMNLGTMRVKETAHDFAVVFVDQPSPPGREFAPQEIQRIQGAIRDAFHSLDCQPF